MNIIESEQRLEKLLAESKVAAIAREQSELERRIGGLDRPFLLFGAGNLGRKALKTLIRIGKTPAAFMDNNPALWGTSILGVPVMSPADAALEFDASGIGVITTIWCGEATDKMADRIDPLVGLGFRKIALFGHLAWKFSDEFLPHYCLDLPSKVIGQAEHVRQAFALLADDESRKIYVDHIEWRLFLDYDILPYASAEEIYFNSKFVNLLDTEVLYDIGAYIGDSVESFLGTARGAAFSDIHSFEPSPGNFLKLQEYIGTRTDDKHRLHAHKLALGDTVGSIQVETEHGPASRVGTGSETVPVSTIDTFSKTQGIPTFIKIDIEGFEPECLAGARQVISDTAPVVAVCVYHLQSHLWDILLQLHSYHAHYSFRLCPHVEDGWDLVLYAVPKNRLPVD